MTNPSAPNHHFHANDHDHQQDSPQASSFVNGSFGNRYFGNNGGMRRFMGAFLYSAKREWHFLSQHRWDFAMLFWLPIVFVGLIWWTFANALLVNIPIAVIDHSHSPQSMTLMRHLQASPELTIAMHLPNQQTAQRAIERTQVYGVLEIPQEFDAHLLSGTPTRLLLNVNAQYATHSGMIQKGVQKAVATLSAETEMKQRIAKGEDISLVQAGHTPIQTQSIGLFNSASNYQQFLAVTILPAMLHILSMVIGASVLGRELRDKTLGEWHACLNPTQPIGKPSLWLIIAGLNGKLIWAMLAYTLWGAMALTLMTRLYPVPLSSLAITYVAFLLFMMLSFWLGAILTLATLSYRQGLSLTGLISAPSYAFSGVTFPLLAMNPTAQRWANALPLTHYLHIQTPQLQMQAPLALALPTMAGFMMSVMVCLCLSALLCRQALCTPSKWGQR